MSVSNKKFRFALRGFVCIAEGLSGIDLRLHREIFRAGDVRRTDVMQVSPARLLHQVEYFSRAIHVHVKDLFAFFVCEGEGCRAMPDIVSSRCRVSEGVSVETEQGLRDVAFDDVQMIEMCVQARGRTGHLAENLDYPFAG